MAVIESEISLNLPPHAVLTESSSVRNAKSRHRTKYFTCPHQYYKLQVEWLTSWFLII